MYISKDVIFVNHEDNYLAYNFELNKLIIINGKTHELLQNHLLSNQVFDPTKCFLSEKEIEVLISYGIIISDVCVHI
ncbi:hypothetical protein FACS189490_05180 [Clostridia bacterium]|nr:hypothetical protein FACS189490_05180 [Clostridia bacterium]